MNDSNPTPGSPIPPVNPNLPSQLREALKQQSQSVPPVIGPKLPAPSDPEEQAPIHGIVAVAEAILRQPRRVMFWLRQQGQGPLISALILIAVICSLVYGIVVGTFSGGQ